MSVLCSPELLCAQVFGCVRLSSEWSQSASKPLDIESQQLRGPLRLPSRFGDRAFIQQEAGWLEYLRLTSKSPSPSPRARVRACERVCVCKGEKEREEEKHNHRESVI